MRWLPLMLLVACVPGPSGYVRTLTAGEQSQVADAMAAWEAAGLEDVAPCVEALPSMRVAVARTHEEMFTLTGYCGPATPETRGTGQEGEVQCRWGRAAGAYRKAREGGAWPFALFGSWWPLIVVWYQSDAERLVRHESVHWLEECSGRGYNPWSPHDDAGVWCPEGCPGRFRR